MAVASVIAERITDNKPETVCAPDPRLLQPGTRQRRLNPIIDVPLSIINCKGFTLVELLVVIGIVALLMAILIPVMSAARERAQRAVCLSNLRQLTMAWITYADEHDGKLVLGLAGAERALDSRSMKGWLGAAFLFPENRSAIIADRNKGPLWPYLRDIDIYRCPRGRVGHACTYKTVSSANGRAVEGTYLPESRINSSDEVIPFGKRVGNTVLRLTRLTDIGSPGAVRGQAREARGIVRVASSSAV